MITQWPTTKLKDVCSRITVGHVGSMSDQYRESGIPFLRSLNIAPFHIDSRDLKFIDQRFHEKLRKSALQPGDIGVVRTGYPGTACVIPKELGEANCSDLVVITPGPGLNAHFLVAIFNSTFGKDLVGGNLVGAAQQHFNVTVAKELKLQIPPRRTQDKIAAILTAYDDLIEVNKRRIALLEKIAEELYREWFVRMRFPGHQNTRFVRGVPEGWDLKRFTELVEMNPRESIPKSDPVPFVGMESLSQTSMHFVWNEARTGASGSKFRNRDTLLPRITPCLENGKRGFVSCLENQQVGVGSTEFIVFREKVLPAEYIYLLSCNASFRQHAELSMTGASGRQRVQHDCFDYFFIPTPPEDIRSRFVGIAGPMFESISQLAAEIEVLTKTRDLLLPRLISGKLSVEDLDIQFPPSMCEEAA
jgi:type I restriction enzyme S subunit